MCPPPPTLVSDWGGCPLVADPTGQEGCPPVADLTRQKVATDTFGSPTATFAGDLAPLLVLTGEAVVLLSAPPARS